MENEVLKVINSRRSIRKYKAEQIKDGELQTLLDAAIQAPSANNIQPWHFTVIQNKEMINEMSDKIKSEMIKSDNKQLVKMSKNMESVFYQAPTIIIVSGKESVQSALVDCSAAIENILLAAESIGLGTVWIGLARFLFKLEKEVEKLNLPTNYQPFYAVAVGYKDIEVSGPSPRKEDVINYIK